MRTSTVATAVGAAIGIAAVLRQRVEAARVRAGDLTPLGPAGRSPSEREHGTLHRALGSWRPRQPATPAGRVAAAVWAAPLTALGFAAALLGGVRPRWDAEAAAWVAESVRGPARWFLRQQGASAATIGHVVIVRGEWPGAVLLAHEAQHARQQERLGLLFGLAYPVASALWGYRDNPFEVAARGAARDASVSGPAASA